LRRCIRSGEMPAAYRTQRRKHVPQVRINVQHLIMALN